VASVLAALFLWPGRTLGRMTTEPTITERPAQRYVAIKALVTMETLGAVVRPLNQEVFAWLAGRGVAPAGPEFWKYNVIDMEHGLEIEAGVTVAVRGAAAGVGVEACPAAGGGGALGHLQPVPAPRRLAAAPRRLAAVPGQRVPAPGQLLSARPRRPLPRPSSARSRSSSARSRSSQLLLPPPGRRPPAQARLVPPPGRRPPRPGRLVPAPSFGAAAAVSSVPGYCTFASGLLRGPWPHLIWPVLFGTGRCVVRLVSFSAA
jgi:hypothetical protein